MHGSSEVSVTLNNAHNTKATTSTSTIPTANITIQTSNTANGTAYTVLTVYDSCPKSEGANLVAFQQANCTYQPWRAYISEEEVNPTVTNVLSLAPIIGLIIVAAALLFFVTRFSGGSGL